jgi:hypothetical protein
MTKKILVVSIALVLSANLLAQVTIGGLKEPKAGAILDLNSDAKGGLVLSNVGISSPTEIPAGFPGVTPENTAAVKAGLKGALVYNTNENTCIGIHAWNGDYWERIAANFVVAQGTPLTSPNAAIAFGGTMVDFTVSLPGAKTYRWYACENNGDYEYLGMTTTNTYSKDFPTGNWKVKVIMDDCHSLTESNEFLFSPASLSPKFGSAAGGNYVYLYGDFPYASSDDYVQTGLVAHYDGINNQNLGDKLHDNDITEWKDLSGNNYNVKLRKGHGGTTRIDATDVTDMSLVTAQWQSNSFLFNDYCYFAKVPADPTKVDALYEIMPELPYGNDNYTVESVFDPSQRSSTYDGFVGWGKNGTDWAANSTMFFCPPTENAQPTFRHFWWSNDVDVKFTDTNPNNIKNFAITYDNNPSASPNNRTFYYNGSENSINYVSTNCGSTTNQCREKTNKNTAKCGSFLIGQTVHVNTNDECITAGENFYRDTYTHGNKIFSIRVYKGALTPEQIAANYEVDKRRFTAPPRVKIGGNLSPEVVVLSPHFLMCKVPQSTIGADFADIEVINADGTSSFLEDAYEYVNATSAFYISSISPIIGDANTAEQSLTLTGNNLDKIDDINVGGQPCTDLDVTPDGKTLTCTLPSIDAGEVDIILTMDNATIYRFAKVFEYK